MPKKKLDCTLSHSEREKIRHQTTQKALSQVAAQVPNFSCAGKETKIQKLKRVLLYLYFLQRRRPSSTSAGNSRESTPKRKAPKKKCIIAQMLKHKKRERANIVYLKNTGELREKKAMSFLPDDTHNKHSLESTGYVSRAVLSDITNTNFSQEGFSLKLDKNKDIAPVTQPMEIQDPESDTENSECSPCSPIPYIPNYFRPWDESKMSYQGISATQSSSTSSGGGEVSGYLNLSQESRGSIYRGNPTSSEALPTFSTFLVRPRNRATPSATVTSSAEVPSSEETVSINSSEWVSSDELVKTSGPEGSPKQHILSAEGLRQHMLPTDGSPRQNFLPSSAFAPPNPYYYEYMPLEYGFYPTQIPLGYPEIEVDNTDALSQLYSEDSFNNSGDFVDVLVEEVTTRDPNEMDVDTANVKMGERNNVHSYAGQGGIKHMTQVELEGNIKREPMDCEISGDDVRGRRYSSESYTDEGKKEESFDNFFRRGKFNAHHKVTKEKVQFSFGNEKNGRCFSGRELDASLNAFEACENLSLMDDQCDEHRLPADEISCSLNILSDNDWSDDLYSLHK